VDGEFQMTLGFVIRSIAIGGVIFLSSLATMLILLAAAPRFTPRIREALTRHREINFLWGLLFVVAVAATAVALSWLGDAGFIVTLVLIAGSAVLALMGLAVVALEMGGKVGRLHRGAEWSDLAAFLVGAAAIQCCVLMPLVGWVLFSYFLTNGLGAVLRVLAGHFYPVPSGKPSNGTLDGGD